MTDVDYLIVGGGTAGCVVASRLSEDPAVRVLLIEAGAADGPAALVDPNGWLGLWHSPVDWADTTVPQRHCDGAVQIWPRGKVLGGSSAINATFHLRGHRSGYDRWEAMGADGWGYSDLLPFLRRSETAPGRDPQVRGTTGPMLIPPHAETDPLSAAWFSAAYEVGHPPSRDGNGVVAEGVSWTDMNSVNGCRQSAADAYLRPVLGRPNLTVVTDAHVTRLVFDGLRCRGADYVTADGDQRAEVVREVVVCAGTVGSPQLLMLSGIGPAEHLCTNGIGVLIDAPGVGANLQDHPMCWVAFAAARPLPAVTAYPHVLFSSGDGGEPDLQITFAPAAFGRRWAVRPEPGFSVTFAVMSPCSRGSVRLSGPDPRDPMLIDPAYFAESQDLERMVIGLRQACKIADSNALKPWRAGMFDPFDVNNDDACGAYIRATAGSYFHPVGTCQIGSGGNAVVDSRLRVRGVDGLRIADASVMPSIALANTNATVLAIAEKAAALILSEHD